MMVLQMSALNILVHTSRKTSYTGPPCSDLVIFIPAVKQHLQFSCDPIFPALYTCQAKVHTVHRRGAGVLITTDNETAGVASRKHDNGAGMMPANKKLLQFDCLMSESYNPEKCAEQTDARSNLDAMV